MSFLKDLADKIERDYGKRLDHMRDTLELAKKLGTFDKDDRSKQYPLDNSQKVINAVNLALTMARKCGRELEEKKKEIHDLKKHYESRIWHRIVVIVAAAEFTLIVMLLGKYAR